MLFSNWSIVLVISQNVLATLVYQTAKTLNSNETMILRLLVKDEQTWRFHYQFGLLSLLLPQPWFGSFQTTSDCCLVNEEEHNQFKCLSYEQYFSHKHNTNNNINGFCHFSYGRCSSVLFYCTTQWDEMMKSAQQFIPTGCHT